MQQDKKMAAKELNYNELTRKVMKLCGKERTVEHAKLLKGEGMGAWGKVHPEMRSLLRQNRFGHQEKDKKGDLCPSTTK